MAMAVFRNMTPMKCYRLPQDVITFGVGLRLHTGSLVGKGWAGCGSFIVIMHHFDWLKE